MPTEGPLEQLKKKGRSLWDRCIAGPRGRPLLLPKVNVCTLGPLNTEADVLAFARATEKRDRRKARNLAHARLVG